MNGLHALPSDRRREIVSSMYDVVTETDFDSAEADSLREELAGLTDDMITFLFTDECDRHKARKVGTSLVKMRCVQPAALGSMLEVALHGLVQSLPTGEVAFLQPRLAILAGEITGGFLCAYRELVASEQDAVYRALMAVQQDAKDALRVSEDRYRAVVTQAREGIVLVDAGTRCIRETNTAFQNLLGFTAKELDGMPLNKIVVPGRRSISVNIRRALDRGRSDLQERRLHHKSGLVIHVEASTLVLETDEGAVLCSVVRDITDRARSSAELAEARSGLAEGLERDRVCLAQELHDTVLQDILGLRYSLGAGMQRMPGGAVDMTFASKLMETEQGLAAVARHLRGIVGKLRPADMDGHGLEVALHEYVASLHNSAEGVPNIDLDLSARAPDLEARAALCLFRVVQEAVRNAVVHAHARRIVVRLRLGDRGVIIRVSDDGCGFTVPYRLSTLARAEQFGLVGMEERVTWSRGRLRVRSRPGRGTTVTVWLPPDGRERESSGNHPSPACR